MNYSIFENQNKKAESAIFLLDKYSKNVKGANSVEVAFIDDCICQGDGYRIEVGKSGICVYGNTPVAFNAAVGYLVRNQHKSIEDRNVSFNSDYRASYFANHFYNYYHAAPVEEICEYLESLALWGQSALCLWFDMHHFESINSPDAREMIDRMLRLFAKAKSLGMKTALMHLSNEYYKGAPRELLAENKADGTHYIRQLSGYYYTELCPSKAEGEQLLLNAFDGLMKRFSMVGLDYVMLWPYDQGGCTCEECYPWGSNGFFKLSKKKAEIARRYNSNVEIIFSAWRFNYFATREWETVLPLIENDGEWIDRLMVDIHDHLPAKLRELNKPIVSFPEISMYHMTPWGGFGANPFPRTLAAQFAATKDFCAGGALYSEGIFEDVNKIVSLELMRDPSTSVEQSVLEYCAYHFGIEHANEIAQLVLRLESTLKRRTFMANGRQNDYPSGEIKELHRYELMNTDGVSELCRDAIAINEKLPQEVRSSWRWVQIYVRACADDVIANNGGVPSAESDEILSKLIPIYHAQKAYYFVCPVTRESILKNRGEGV
jgi:hypothetical protein